MAMCYNSDCERVEHYSCKQCDCNIAHKCEEYASGRPTNADRIRAMSDEELAEYFAKTFCHGYGQPQLLDWLQKPARGEGEQA